MPIAQCFTVQCCWGHFVHRLEPNPKNLVPPSHYKGVKEKIGTIRYRIAYLAVCLEDSWGGHEIYHGLGEMAKRDPSSAAERKIPVVVDFTRTPFLIP